MDITTFLLESICQDKTPDEYKRMFDTHFGEIAGWLRIPKGQKVHNPRKSDKTGDRKAFGGYPWIKYWQAFTGNYQNKLKCACCGKNIYVDENAQECLNDVDKLNEEKKEKRIEKEDLKAVGGHLYANGIDATNGYIIVPMCKEHNNKKSEEEMEIALDIAAVREIHATIKLKK